MNSIEPRTNSEKLSKKHNLKKAARIWTEVCWSPKSVLFPWCVTTSHWFVLAAQGNIFSHGRGSRVLLSKCHPDLLHPLGDSKRRVHKSPREWLSQLDSDSLGEKWEQRGRYNNRHQKTRTESRETWRTVSCKFSMIFPGPNSFLTGYFVVIKGS